MPLFEPRRDAATSPYSEDSEMTESSMVDVQQYFTVTKAASEYTSFPSIASQKELTKNDHYRVCRLRATPPTLNSSVTSGCVDSASKFACVVSNSQVVSWDYTCVDSEPACHFVAAQGASVVPVLVLAAPGASNPGLVTIDTDTGAVVHYADINGASNVLYNRVNASAKISLRTGEKITIVENVEPVGIVVGTSHGRCVLVRIRDGSGNPRVTWSVVGSSSLLPFFGSKPRLAALRAGKLLGQASRSLIMLTQTGVFSQWSLSQDGQAIKLWEASIMDSLVAESKDLYDNDDIKILDCSPLSQEDNDSALAEAFLVLTSVTIGPSDCCYILFTFKRSGNELLLFSAYRLTRYTKVSTQKPKLYLPKPGSTVFVSFDDAIVLVEVPKKLEHSAVRHRKWEDIVIFRHGTGLVFVGVENAVQGDNSSLLPSIVVITQHAGVLRLERSADADADDSAVASSFAKTHIEQAVFYGYRDNNPLSFRVPLNSVEDHEVTQAIVDVSNEITQSRSSYLPPRLSSIQQHLELRFQQLRNLAEYCADNFDTDIDTKAKVIFDLEKVNAATKIWSAIFDPLFNTGNQQWLNLFGDSIKEILEGHVELLELENLNNKQTIELFFYYHLDKMGLFISHVLGHVLSAGDSLNYDHAVVFVIKSIKDGAIDIESETKSLFSLQDDDFGSVVPWILEDGLCFKISILFDNYFKSVQSLAATPDSVDTVDISNKLVSLVSILFYSFHLGLSFYTSTPLTKATRDKIEQYKSTYEGHRGDWIKSLLYFGETDAALQLAEQFEDLLSLVQICDQERERVLAKGLDDTFVLERLDQNFKKFGYKFAETLYNHYVFNHKLQDLLLGFPQYNHYLRRFLKPDSLGRISWIRSLLDDQYYEGATILVNVCKKADNLISNKKLQLSIAKLSILAQEEDENPGSADVLADIERGLSALNVQESLYNEVSQFRVVDKQVDLITESEETLEKLTVKLKQRNPGLMYTNLKKSFTKLLSRKSVPVLELVDLLTLLDIITPQMKLNYSHALKLTTIGALDYAEQKICWILIWRRAILCDNWVEIGRSINTKTPDSVQKFFEDSVLYVTLLNCFRERLFSGGLPLPNVHLLAQPISEADLVHRFKDLSHKGISSVNEALNKEAEQISKIIQSFDFESHVKGIIGTARENSGTQAVVDYDRLVVE